MSVFYFDDCDPINEDLAKDICGKDFIDLINYSMRYCTYFSVDFHIKYKIDNKLRPQLRRSEVFDLSLFHKSREQNCHLIPPQQEYSRHYYWLNNDTSELIVQLQDSLFNWELYSKYKMPENITFYRSDGSVFFTSITHEGFAYLYLNANEDMNHIVKNRWEELPETVVCCKIDSN